MSACLQSCYVITAADSTSIGQSAIYGRPMAPSDVYLVLNGPIIERQVELEGPPATTKVRSHLNHPPSLERVARW